MPPTDYLQFFATGTGGAILMLAIFFWWSREGTIRWGKSVDAAYKQYEERIAAQDKQIKELREDHRAELAQVRADYAAQVAREVGRLDKAWDSLDPLTEDLHKLVFVQEQQGRTLALLVTGSPAPGASSPPAGPDPPALPSPRRRS